VQFRGYNRDMHDFNFFQEVQVRYGDIDPQAHVNNAKYFTYTEQARVAYIQELNLWDGDSFMDFGFILAEARMSFKSPIFFDQQIRVGVAVTEIRNKSLLMEYVIEDLETAEQLAAGSSILVAYDYRERKTMPIPENWRQVIATFENQQF
jgi:acyl-CoA thioester hydrolase